MPGGVPAGGGRVIVAAPPAAPVVAASPVVFGGIAVRSGGGTRLLVPTADGRALPAVRVRPGARRVAVPLPTGHWRVRVRAVGPRGARASRAHDVWVLPARGRTAGTSRGRLDRVLQRRLEARSAAAPFVNGIYARNLVTGCGAAVNAGAPFPAASTLKAAILLDAVRRPHGEPDALLDRMIIDSDDVAANRVLGMQGGGDALAGAASVTSTMHDAGMTRSLVRRPYIIDQERIPVDARAQPELYTNYVATPYDLATLMVGLHQAVVGRGACAAWACVRPRCGARSRCACCRCGTARRSWRACPRPCPSRTRPATPRRSRPTRASCTRRGGRSC